MNEQDLEFLMLIPSTEPFDFGELCSALGGDVPGDRGAWAELFAKIKHLEQDGFVEVERAGGRLESIMLAPAGAALIRDRLDQKRGLLAIPGI
jgi:hypothetical protein